MNWLQFNKEHNGQEVIKPWGLYKDHIRTSDLVIKTLIIKPGCSISYQVHFMRAEFWYIVAGTGLLKISPDEIAPSDNYFVERVISGQSRTIDEGVAHQIINDGKEDLVIFEVQYGAPNERDIKRIEDPYKDMRGQDEISG